jgi:hypothetical protein
MTYITRITNTTTSTSATSGAFVVDGGSGFGGSIYAGNSVTVAGIISLLNSTASTNTTTGALAIPYGGVGIGGALNVGGTSTLADLVASSISGSVIATEAQVDAGSATDVVITPATLSYALANAGTNINLSSPGPIGDTAPNSGQFTTLTATGVTDLKDNVTAEKALTVTGATTLSSTLGVTGATTLSDSLTVGTTLAVTGTSTLTGDVSMAGALDVSGDTTLAKATIDSIAGNVVATTSDVDAGTSSTKVITPSTLKYAVQNTASVLLSAPDKIGDVTPNEGYFSKLDASTDFNSTGAATFGSTVDVTGAVTAESTLAVTGATTLSDTLAVTKAATLSSTLGVTGATTLSSTLGVTGATTLSSTLGVTGNTTLTGTLTANDTADFAEAVTMAKTLDVTGNATFAADVSIDSLSGNVIATTSDVDTGTSTAKVITPSTLKYAVQNTASVLLSAPDAIGDVTPNSGAFTTLSSTGATTVGTTLDVTGATTLSDTLAVTGATTLSDTLAVTKGTTLSSTLGVTGATTLSSTLGVTGNTSLTTLYASGAATLDSTLAVTGTATISGDLKVAGYIGRGKRTTVECSPAATPTTYTVLESDYILGVTDNSAAITLTLPTISSMTDKNKIYIVKAEVALPNITIQVGDSETETIDGDIDMTLTGSYNAISLYCDGTSKWFVF